MSILQIHDAQPSSLAVVDPRYVLALLGGRATRASWRFSGVERYDEAPMISGGDAANRLEELSRSEEVISGTMLTELIGQTVQIIWGEFRAYEKGIAAPWVIVRAIDSTWCEVEADDEDVLDLVRRSFTDVRTPA